MNINQTDKMGKKKKKTKADKEEWDADQEVGWELNKMNNICK